MRKTGKLNVNKATGMLRASRNLGTEIGNGFGSDPIPTIPLTPDTAQLLLINGKQKARFSLNKMRTVIGRNYGSSVVDIDLTEWEQSKTPSTSRRHGEIQWENGELKIVDLI